VARFIPASVITLLVALLVPAGAQAAKGQATLFEAPRELLSDDAQLRTQTLDEIRGFGVSWLRVIVYWRSVAPDADRPGVPRFEERDPAQYPGFGKYDRAIDEARAKGFRILLTVSGPVPRWATERKEDNVTRPSATRFGRFAQAVGTRYAGKVDHWSIWNEPNHPQFLQPQYSPSGRAVSPGLYRQLFRQGAAGIRRSGNAQDTILLGETAPRGTGKVVAPLRFLRGTLCLDSRYRKRSSCGRLSDADAVAHHAYTTRQGPTFVPPNRDDVTIGVLSRLTRAVDRAERAGALRAGRPIWLTEFGIQSHPDRQLGVPETQQAEFRAISERIAWRNPSVVAFSQYLMRDDDPNPAARTAAQRHPCFESGLRGADGDPKRAYEGFRLPLVAVRGSRRTTLWGIARPAGTATAVRLDFLPEGSSRWRKLKTVRTDARGAFQTSTAKVDGRRYRVAWGGFTGPVTRAYAP
jgi:hypothetical protein